jgi:hypothetical protein
VPLPTVAAVVVALVHEPLPDPSLSAVVEPLHTLSIPVMPSGTGLTVTVFTALHPVPAVKVIVAVPPVPNPVTTPVPDTVATEVLLLLQVPAPTSFKEVVDPEHTVAVPVIAAGKGLTVTVAIVVHPVAGAV